MLSAAIITPSSNLHNSSDDSQPHPIIIKYSGALFIQSQMGPKNLAVLTGDCIKEGFLQEDVWSFCRATKKSGHNNKVRLL